jgi:hypothetical protein
MSADIDSVGADIRARITIPVLAQTLCPGWKPAKSCRSPFRDDKNPSCSVFVDDNGISRFKDYASGVKAGDVFDFYQLATGCDKRQAFLDLKEMMGGATITPTPAPKASAPRGSRSEADEFLRWHPTLSKPSASALQAISDQRSIGMQGLQIAVERGFLWTATLKSHPAWVLTDRARKSYLARHLDGKVWEHLTAQPKAWLLPGSRGNWPIGIQESEPYPAIALCEGGPDFLSAFAHAWASGVEDRVAPVCMSSAGGSIADDALPYFRGKTVRVFVHDDNAGWDACARWQRQLLDVAHSHSFYTFNNLVQIDSKPVKDLNDLLRLDYDNWEQNREAVEAVMDFAEEDRANG